MSDIELTGRRARTGEEASLIARAAGGDREAYAELIAPRVDRSLRTARAILGNDAEAHDAAQEAFVAAWIHLPRLRDASRFDAWLQRTLVNQCRETLRQRRRSREIWQEADAPLADFSRGSVETASIKAAFGRLSVDERTVLLLHHLHGMPVDEVGRQLGIPAGTAKSRLWHARRSLERALEAES